jgi:hypothetical protein
MAKKAVERAIARGRTRLIERAMHEVAGTSARLSQRADGARLTRATEEVEVLARQAQRQGTAAGPDLTNALARKISELASLAGERGLARAPATVLREESDGPTQSSDANETEVFDEWIDELRGKGMTEPEIEEHVIAVLRGLRAQMMSESNARLVAGRK